MLTYLRLVSPAGAAVAESLGEWVVVDL